MPFGNVARRPGKFFFLFLAAFTILLSPLSASAQEVVIQQPMDIHQVRKELQVLLRSTQKLANSAGQYMRINPAALMTLNDQIIAAQYMSQDELEVYQTNRPMLVELRERINQLNQAISEQPPIDAFADPGSFNSSTQFAVGLRAYTCPASESHYSPNWFTSWVAAPQGPCGQLDLADARHPVLCPLATPPTFLIPARQVASIARGAVSVFKAGCWQSVFGNNTSGICITLEVIYTVVKEIFEYADKCNNKRSEAESFYTYVRTGELFVKNKSNFAAQNVAMERSQGKIDAAEERLVDTDGNDGVIDIAGASMRNAMNSGLTGIGTRLTQLETESIKNSQVMDRVLREQLEIMKLLGIDYLHQAQNTLPTEPTSYSGQATISERDQKLPEQPVVPAKKQRGETR